MKNWQVFLVAFVFIALFTKGSIESGNDASRIATVESLVERGTFVIDDSSLDVYNHSKFNDKISYEGHFYSSKPPVLSFISTPPYFILYRLGIEFKDFGEPSLAYYIQTLLTIGLFYSLLIMLFYMFLKRKGVKDSLWMTIGLGAGTLVFVYGTVFNNHIPSVSMLFAAFYIVYFKDLHRPWLLTLAGLCAGLAISFEPPILIVVSFITLMFQQKHKDFRNASIGLTIVWLIAFLNDLDATVTGITAVLLLVVYRRFFLELAKKYYPYFIGILVPMALYALLNMQIIESPLPQHLHPDHREFYSYPGGPWPKGDPTGQIPALEYVLHSTLGYRGLLSYSPILLLGVIGIYLGWKKERGAISVGLSALMLLLYYAVGDTNYGGYSYGNRRLLALTPLILIFCERYAKKKVFFFLLAVSIIFALIGVYAPWADIFGYDMFLNQPIPLLNNLKNFVQEFTL